MYDQCWRSKLISRNNLILNAHQNKTKQTNKFFCNLNFDFFSSHTVVIQNYQVLGLEYFIFS
jgi:hypothetical protein